MPVCIHVAEVTLCYYQFFIPEHNRADTRKPRINIIHFAFHFDLNSGQSRLSLTAGGQRKTYRPIKY